MADNDTDAPEGADFTPVNVVVLKAGRPRYQAMVEGHVLRKRTRMAVGHVIQLPRYFVDRLLLAPAPMIRPAAPDELLTEADLFETEGDSAYPHAPGSKGDGGTSQAAAEDLKGAKHRNLVHRVLTVITDQGDFGATSEEIAAILRRPRGSVQPRTSELQELGRIRKSGRTRTNLSSKKAAAVWVHIPGSVDRKLPRKASRGVLVDLLRTIRPVVWDAAVAAGSSSEKARLQELAAQIAQALAREPVK